MEFLSGTSEERKSWINHRVSAALALTLFLAPIAAVAQTAAETRGQLNQTETQINQLQHEVDHHAHEAATLEAQIAAMNAEIEAIKASIASVQSQIVELNGQIAEIEVRMAAKRTILSEYIKNQYYLSQTTTLEVLVESKNLSEFVDRQQYLESAQQKVQEMLAEITAIKQDLDRKKAGLTELNNQLAAQQAGLAAQRAAKNDLLAKTRGEQARYEEMLRQAQAARARLNATLAALYGNGPIQSKGHVERGQLIGREGSTGFSTGPHLHFGTYVDGNHTDPMPYINNGKFMWPMTNFEITQTYGNPNSWYQEGYHNGIDMAAPYGQPVMAAADGEIIINSFQPGGFGHYIVVDHGGGLWSLYAHMQ